MKLIIQIPCYNEEETLEVTYNDLPKQIKGIDIIETLIINDGSNDATEEVARKIGITHIVSFSRNKGLAKAFASGIERCLHQGADIIVNTDADNQYCGADIAKLVEPIVNGEADVVVGDRQTDTIEHFSFVKRKLQNIGSSLIRSLSQTDVKDAVSGFRAYSRDAAMRINIMSEFSYTVENIIQFGQQKIKIASVPIRTNGKLRESRLFKSIPSFISNQLKTLFRVYVTYRALRVFSIIGTILLLPGVIGLLRFLIYYLIGQGDGHIQSLIYSAVFVNVGFVVFMFGIIAELISNNRKLTEQNLYISKKILDKLENK
jgi:glycosyltransferase involved in cell wall biosynthesis